MAGQLPESEAAARCPGVAACMGERQACLHSWGLSGSLRLCIYQYLSVFVRCVDRAKYERDKHHHFILQCPLFGDDWIIYLDGKSDLVKSKDNYLYVFCRNSGQLTCQKGKMFPSHPSDCFSSRILNISSSPSPWRISFLTEVCCTKGNWCSQVWPGGIDPKRFMCLVLSVEHNLTRFYFFLFITREHKAYRRLHVSVWRIPADYKDKEEQEGTAHHSCSHSVRYSVRYTHMASCRTVQRSMGPEQNPLRLPQKLDLELDLLLKEGCTFMVLDQPVSLDRLQLKNIDQLNASSN